MTKTTITAIITQIKTLIYHVAREKKKLCQIDVADALVSPLHDEREHSVSDVDPRQQVATKRRLYPPRARVQEERRSKYSHDELSREIRPVGCVHSCAHFLWCWKERVVMQQSDVSIPIDELKARLSSFDAALAGKSVEFGELLELETGGDRLTVAKLHPVQLHPGS